MPKKSIKWKEKVGSSSQKLAPPKKSQNTSCIKIRLFFKIEELLMIWTIAPSFIQKFIDNGWKKLVSDLPNSNPTLTLNFYRIFNKSIRVEGSPTYHKTTVNGKMIILSPKVIDAYIRIDRTNAVAISTMPNEDAMDETVL